MNELFEDIHALDSIDSPESMQKVRKLDVKGAYYAIAASIGKNLQKTIGEIWEVSTEEEIDARNHRMAKAAEYMSAFNSIALSNKMVSSRRLINIYKIL